MVRSLGWVVLWVACATVASAADYRVETIGEPPKEGVPDGVRIQLGTKGVRVIRGESRVVCDIWLSKEWPVESFEAKNDAVYPFRPGQFLGIVQYPRKGKDFRDQTIDPGIYTLRFGLQPVDGAHEGTSPTRDFALLVRIEDDKSLKPIETETLNELSIEAVGTAHPGMLAIKGPEGQQPMRHNQEEDWWMVRLEGQAKAQGKSKKIVLDVVVVGHARE